MTQTIIDIVNNMSATVIELDPIQPANIPEVVEEPVIPIEPQGVDTSNQVEEPIPQSHAEEVPIIPRSTHSTKGVAPEKLTLLARIYTTISELDMAKEKTKLKAIEQEIMLIFQELKAAMPVMKSSVANFVLIYLLSGKVPCQRCI